MVMHLSGRKSLTPLLIFSNFYTPSALLNFLDAVVQGGRADLDGKGFLEPFKTVLQEPCDTKILGDSPLIPFGYYGQVRCAFFGRWNNF